jgi:hypothetical protein
MCPQIPVDDGESSECVGNPLAGKNSEAIGRPKVDGQLSRIRDQRLEAEHSYREGDSEGRGQPSERVRSS